MTQVEAVVQRYYGDRPVIQRIDNALRAAGIDPERPSHRDLWPLDQPHSRGIVATREHAERARLTRQFPRQFAARTCGTGHLAEQPVRSG
jgi:hypothetical protein